jgi:hypothetical protein
VGRKAEPPSVGRKAEPPSVGEVPERGLMSNHRTMNLNFIAWCRRHNVGCGLLPTPDYILEGVEETALLPRIEAAQLRGVPWVLYVFPRFRVA